MERLLSSRKGRAIASAIGLSVLGPLIAVVLVLSAGLVVGTLGVELTILWSVILTLVLGQYVAFGGLSAAYLKWRDLTLDYLGVRIPSLRDVGVTVGGYLLAFVLGLLGSIVVSLILSTLGMEPATNPTADVSMENPEIIPVLILGMILVVGPAEEVLFRGVIQSRLREALDAPAAIVLASVLFALIHAPILSGPTASSLIAAVFLVFPSLVFGAAYEYTDNIVVPSLIHGFYNATLLALVYLFVTLDLDPEQTAEAIVLVPL